MILEKLNYEIEASVVDSHWWFRGRRRLFGKFLTDLNIDADAEIVDIGSSSGTNLTLLKDRGYRNVRGVDNSEESVRFCKLRDLPPVVLGDATALPFANNSFDFAFATDVLEHLERDDQGAAEIFRVLRPGRFALVTVPAFKLLWGLQDDISHHKRRYRLSEVQALLSKVGFEIGSSFYFNFLLFLPVLFARVLYRLGFLKKIRNENQINTPLINRILEFIFLIDLRWAPKLKIPFGISALVIVRKPKGAP